MTGVHLVPLGPSEAICRAVKKHSLLGWITGGNSWFVRSAERRLGALNNRSVFVSQFRRWKLKTQGAFLLKPFSWVCRWPPSPEIVLLWSSF